MLENRKHVHLRLHPEKPEVYFAYKESTEDAPVWCVNSHTKVIFFLNFNKLKLRKNQRLNKIL
jgi:hypothetical protein